jgi:hypothetical protein
MNTTTPSRFSLGVLALLVFTPFSSLLGQSFRLGADMVSRYVWRGADFGESASIQPALAFSAKGLEVGSWASYSMSADGAGANEHDLWVGYTVSAGERGSLSLGVTDYYFPSPHGSEFLDYSGDGEGSHWIEPYASYSGPPSLPISLYAGMFAHNDPDYSLYLEASYSVAVDGVDLGITVGAVGGESDLYGTEDVALVNLGLSATKSVSVSETITLPISVSYILNPDGERSFLVFGMGLSL